MIQGVLPMAGKASRWHGIYKEFLPIGDDFYLVDVAISAMNSAGAKKFLIITNKDKIQEHARHFSKPKYNNLNIVFVLQKGEELIGAINTAIEYQEDLNLFAMPDTFFDTESLATGVSIFKDMPSLSFVIGLFRTSTPERFGCLLYESEIPFFVDKPQNLPKNKMYDAWGSFIFKRGGALPSDNLNSFMNTNNSFVYYQIGYYYDLASFEYYKELLSNYAVLRNTYDFWKYGSENTSIS